MDEDPSIQLIAIVNDSLKLGMSPTEINREIDLYSDHYGITEDQRSEIYVGQETKKQVRGDKGRVSKKKKTGKAKKAKLTLAEKTAEARRLLKEGCAP